MKRFWTPNRIFLNRLLIEFERGSSRSFFRQVPSMINEVILEECVSRRPLLALFDVFITKTNANLSMPNPRGLLLGVRPRLAQNASGSAGSCTPVTARDRAMRMRKRTPKCQPISQEADMWQNYSYFWFWRAHRSRVLSKTRCSSSFATYLVLEDWADIFEFVF